MYVCCLLVLLPVLAFQHLCSFRCDRAVSPDPERSGQIETDAGRLSSCCVIQSFVR